MNRFRILTALLFAALLVSGALASCHAKTEKPMTSATEPFASGVTEAPTDAPQSTEKPQETTKKPQQTTKKPETTKKPQETETPEDANAPTVGLEFKLTEDGTGYAVSAGSATGKSRIVIPAEHNGKPVTEIAYNGFVRCSLKSIVIPDSITAIGSNAFEFCTELTEVTSPDSVTNPGWFTFVACRKLTSVTLPGGLTEITPGLFQDCSALKSITIPNTVTSIGEGAFSGCRALKELRIPQGVTLIMRGAIQYCDRLQTLVIPASVTNIRDYALRDCRNLKTVTYEGTVAQWNRIKKGGYNPGLGSGFWYEFWEGTVQCTDGTVVYPEA